MVEGVALTPALPEWVCSIFCFGGADTLRRGTLVRVAAPSDKSTLDAILSTGDDIMTVAVWSVFAYCLGEGMLVVSAGQG
ncbi:hypothetical protein ES703_74936 [subsurface metagenome]